MERLSGLQEAVRFGSVRPMMSENTQRGGSLPAEPIEEHRSTQALPVRFLIVSGILSLCSFGLLFVLSSDPVDALVQHWWISPLAFFAAAFANATAVGGGFVFVPVFILGYGLAPISALQLSLGTQSFGMTSGAFGWSKECIEPRYLVLGTLGSTAGMIWGTFGWIATAYQIKSVFGWVSLAIAVVMAIEARYGKDGVGTRVSQPSWGDQIGFVTVCVFGGLITAWVSLGIGEVVALWLLFRHRLRIETAIGTGVAALAISSVMGFAFHGADPAFPWEFLAFTVPGVLFGGFCGGRGGRWLEETMARQGKKSPLKAIFAGVVLLDGLVMLVQVYGSG